MIYHCRVAGREIAVEIVEDQPTPRIRVAGREVACQLSRLPGSSEYSLILGRKSLLLSVTGQRGAYQVSLDGAPLDVEVQDELERRLEGIRPGGPAAHRVETVKAPMPGIVSRITVSPGQAVKAGDLLLVLEAMKMANEVCARRDGSIRAVSVSAGQAVSAGEPLVTLE